MASPKPDVMEVGAFKEATTPPKVRKKLEPIDDELLQFHLYKNRGPQDAIDHIFRVITAIQFWYTRKAQKIGKGGKNITKRKQVVDTLLQQCIKRLAWEQFNYRKLLHQGNYRDVTQNFAFAIGPKQLGNGYAVERQLFLQMKAQNYTQTGEINPIGGSFAHDVMHRAAASQDVNVQAIGQKQFSQLTMNDFQVLQQHYSLQSMQMDFVHYIRKDERLANNFVFINRGLLYLNGKLMHTGNNDIGWLYAMDEYGNVVAVNQQGNPGNMQQYNHSSLCAGRGVICAGNIIVRDGRLLYIDNASGHYQPTPQHLQNCCVCLVEENEVDLTATIIKVNHPGDIFTKHTWLNFSANAADPGQNVNRLGEQDN